MTAMNLGQALCALAAAAAAAGILSSPHGSQSSQDSLVRETLKYKSLEPLHKDLADMVEASQALCTDPKVIHGPHLKPGIRTYINKKGLGGAKVHEQGVRFPVGTLLVKEKFDDRASAIPTLATAMRKARPGRGADTWDYVMVSLATKRPVKPAAPCLGCHRRWEATDGISPQGAEWVRKRKAE